MGRLLILTTELETLSSDSFILVSETYSIQKIFGNEKPE